MYYRQGVVHILPVSMYLLFKQLQCEGPIEFWDFPHIFSITLYFVYIVYIKFSFIYGEKNLYKNVTRFRSIFINAVILSRNVFRNLSKIFLWKKLTINHLFHNVHTSRFLKYVWPFFNIIKQKVKTR